MFYCLRIKYLVTSLNSDFSLQYCLFGCDKVGKYTNPDKHKHSGCGIGFDSCSESSLTYSNAVKNIILFVVNMSSSVHIDNKNKDILILGKGLSQRLDDTMLTGEAHYSKAPPTNFPL